MNKLYLESKHADVKAYRDNDFNYAWILSKEGEGEYISVEYIPDNYPCLTTVTGNLKEFERYKKTLEEIGFEVYYK